ncbi:MAG: hypothetical protein SFU57_13145 [Gemmatimonadales bacterium]|nr:hypothetical protein [Gemmatimonadales bacterium]
MYSPGRWYLCVLGLLPATITAQSWRSGEELPLVVAAVEARAARDQDRALAGWRAIATGLVRFASVVEHVNGPIERVIRADELRVEVYGEAPNWSKQQILAWRDTNFLPNRIFYHRDHLGIVANDFGSTIRLGNGDEVRDVPHPLSPAGLGHYQFALGDTVSVARRDGTIRVVAIAVRPTNHVDAAAVGTLYLDLARAVLVRFRFTFTPAAYRDNTVADITVDLENALVDGQQWLPWRQSITIRRETPWLALPIGSVLRADWTIDEYELGLALPVDQRRIGEIGGLRSPNRQGDWEQPLSERLTEVPATGADRESVERMAMEHLEGASLSGMPPFRFGANGLSDLLHLNRVQGVVPGVGAQLSSGQWQAAVHLGLGTSDGRVVGRVAVNRPVGRYRLGVAAHREMRDIGDLPVVSRVQNSLRTLVDGSDRGDWTLVEEVMLSATGRSGPTDLTVEAGWRKGHSASSAFTALDGTRRENPALGASGITTVRGTAVHSRSTGLIARLAAEAGVGGGGWQRLAARMSGDFPMGSGRFDWVVGGGFGSRRLPPYRGFVLGGQGSLPGVGFRAIGGRRAADATIAWLVPVALPSPPIRVLRGAALTSRVGPFLAAGVAGGQIGETRWNGGGVIHPVLGLRTELWGPSLRLDLGVALRTRDVGITVDLHPSWWPVM